MNKITPEDFAMVCFLVLMENGLGVIDKHLSYINEKQFMLREGYEAFTRLDIHNMRKVDMWCREWGVEMPADCARYLEQSEEALAEMERRGFKGL